MKKLIIAVCLIILTAAFEQKAASTVQQQKLVPNAASSLDTLANKLEHLNSIRKL